MTAGIAENLQAVCEGVVCDRAVLRAISTEAVEGLLKLRHGGLEVGGVLFGLAEHGRVRIAASRPFKPTYEYGPVYRLSEQDIHALQTLIATPESDPELAGMNAAGWYVSHTRSDVALTDNNVAVFSECFPQSGQVTLVLKPGKFEPSQATPYLRDPEGALVMCAEFLIDPREFDVESEQAAIATAAPSGAASGKPSAPAESLPSLQSLPSPEIHLQNETEPVIVAIDSPVPRARWSRKRTAVTAAIWALMAVALVLAVSFGRASRTPPRVTAPVPALVRTAVESPASAQLAVESMPVSEVKVQEPTPTAPAPEANAGPPNRVQELEREVAELRSRLKSSDSVIVDLRPRTFVPPPDSRRDTVPPSSMTMAPAPSMEGLAVVVPAQQPLSPPLAIAAPVAPPLRTRAKAEGRLIWTGSLRKGALLFIEDARPSTGALTGKLPGGPVNLHIYPGELKPGGMLIYTTDPKLAGRSEPPREANGWNHTIFEHDSKRVKDIEVMESPRSENGWKKVVLRNVNRPVGVIVVDWESSGDGQRQP